MRSNPEKRHLCQASHTAPSFLPFCHLPNRELARLIRRSPRKRLMQMRREAIPELARVRREIHTDLLQVLHQLRRRIRVGREAAC